MTGPARRTLAEFADIVAMGDSEHTSALAAHRIITTHLWRALRTLGFDSGRVLVHGDDPATFLGQPHTSGYGFASLTATVGPAHRPGDQIRAEEFTNSAEDFDLVIAALPFNDVKFAHPAHQVRRRALEDALALACLDFTRPGGITAVLASHNLLDSPHTQVRHEIARQGDLIGAVRLPGAIQRNVAGTDIATDLLLVHRVAPDERPTGIPFTAVAPVIVQGRTLLLNTYFGARPDHVLGQLGVDPLASGPNALTVSADPTRFDVDLGSALEDIATTANRAGVVYSHLRTATDVRTQTQNQIAPGGTSLNASQPLAPEPHDPDLDLDPDRETPNLGETGPGLW